LGDNADMAMIDLLISTNFTLVVKEEVKSRRGGKAKKQMRLLKSGC
jgi:hypothetical protein